jgi:hypothetical protein
MKTSVAMTVSAVLLGVSLSACADEAAVCSSVDSLKASIDDLVSVDVTSGEAVAELESGLTAVRSDLDSVKADAEAELSSEIGTVETTYTALTAAVDTALTTPSATTLATAGSALSAFASEVDALVSAAEATC